ncbi:hypothetical protein [Nannocystis sp. SCPEA4]|uniref:hypothetical protein n=1 Tax=Nannocystis sp. SCPEA4 TaxID=2996787 RepID=UPI002270BD0A|nr:hypothetical protein [Nannocystis sp. SCPEA4]MCY1057426.1 hypothetical protein [Nannocystis sp. SCPEA4]
MSFSTRSFALGLVVHLAVVGCGDDKAGTDTATGTAGPLTTSLPPVTTTGTTDHPTTSDGTMSGGETTTGTTTGAVSVTAAPTTGTTEQTKFDLGIQPDQPGGTGCGGGGGGNGMPEFSYIWIANSVEGTVSKIDTFTGVEVGRYVSGPLTEGLGNVNNGPSRTSVNLYGDAAVANRNGGVTKIAARHDDCPDTNGNGIVDTSTGPLDVKPWGQDECVLWHHPTPTNPQAFQEGPRPLAWVGEIQPDKCPAKNPPLWFGYYKQAQNLGAFERLDGATGTTLDALDVPWSGNSWGPYGGAVNKDGDFFVTGWSTGPAIRIAHDTLQVTVFANNGFPSYYGMALDANGELWVAGCDSIIYHLDPNSQIWTQVGTGPGCLRGIQVDKMGRAFIAHNGFPAGIVVVDTVSKTILNPNVPLPGASTPVGISVDVEGYVWVVDQGGWAYKVDPDSYQVVLQVMGLNQPYTYSDMTGAGLNLVVNPQG